ncbi:MAG TPA: hypothetical protein VK669_12165 [Candidatus Limnocylindrales bacterium]|nr:hypothetical protein [Candidatus Limnocylindrales bacterium]
MTTSPILRIAAVLALLQGSYMLADGAHFLTSGAYFGNGLGPWAALVARAGMTPLSSTMAWAFVAFGVLWLAAGVALALGRARYAVVVLAVATLWYAAFGTVLSVVIGFLALRAPRANAAVPDL